jgi:CelD/BcsL family acetyltransferase involved in cellulose biosynthesis
MADAEVVEDPDAAEALAPAWDELAVSCALPLCAPGWMLPWWSRLKPPDSSLRIFAVREGGELIGLAPWFMQTSQSGRRDLRFLGAEFSDRVDVLCRPGREREVASELRGAIARLRPGPDLIAFEATPAASRWTKEIAGGTAGRALLARYRNSLIAAPTVTLPQGAAGKPDSWLAGRSSNFRSQMRRMRRRLEGQGGRVRQITGADEVGLALDALLRMHTARWEERAPSHLTHAGVPEFLHQAAAALGPDRLRLWAAEIEGELISVQLFQAAGGEIKYWNGGWMEEHAAVKPTMLTILAALEDGIARGERRLDLGAGTHPYKLRFADGDDPLAWGGLIVRNARWPRTRAELMPRVLRYRAKQAVQALPEPLRERLLERKAPAPA